ncbi:MAG: hypothetical protein GVY09_01215 [Gammaproteobacteria bacterium]|jgi:hypothetical protein|nr:hypothetical protein [Gammaproteobacteria bacterium]
MKALYIAMQDPDSRRWAPVARLRRENGHYLFDYRRGTQCLPNFEPFERMSKVGLQYVSDALFPLFANRVLAVGRPEYHDYLRWLGLTEQDHDALEELARTGGRRATDTLEVVPCPEPTPDGRYELHFFARGLPLLGAEEQARAAKLVPGERLYLLKDLQNTRDTMGQMLRTDDPPRIVGYVPRYYCADVSTLLHLAGPEAVTVIVERINPDAPIQYRLLCRLSAPWPADFQPCADDEFQPVTVNLDDLPHAEPSAARCDYRQRRVPPA